MTIRNYLCIAVVTVAAVIIAWFLALIGIEQRIYRLICNEVRAE